MIKGWVIVKMSETTCIEHALSLLDDNDREYVASNIKSILFFSTNKLAYISQSRDMNILLSTLLKTCHVLFL